MSQHDYNIANAPGATVRADINALAEALGSNNGGASAPSVTFALMWWYDSTNGLLKIRNAANSAWLTVAAIGSSFQYLGATIAIAQGGTGKTTNYEAVDNLNATGYVNVASGATTNIGGALSQKVNITGTTTITAFDNVAAGIERIIRFNGALTLTYNATSMITPGAADIKVNAGDQAVAVSLGSGNWRIASYTENRTPNRIGLGFIAATYISATTNFTWNAKTKYLRIRAVASGGGGGGGNATDGDAVAAAGGGSSGQFCEFVVSTTGLTSPLAITMGAAGTGGSAGGSGGAGGDLVIGSLATLKGGLGGTGITSGGYSAGDGALAPTGGSVPGGALKINGGSASPGLAACGRTGDQNSGMGGAGGTSFFGGGGSGVSRVNDGGDNGVAGEAPGSGGGGGVAINNGNATGGAGAVGLVIIEEFD